MKTLRLRLTGTRSNVLEAFVELSALRDVSAQKVGDFATIREGKAKALKTIRGAAVYGAAPDTLSYSCENFVSIRGGNVDAIAKVRRIASAHSLRVSKADRPEKKMRSVRNSPNAGTYTVPKATSAARVSL